MSKIIADKLGWDIQFVYNDSSKKTADTIINDEYWEIKTNYTNTISAIDSAIKNAKGQSENVILHIQSDIQVDTVISTVKHRMERSKKVKKIIIVTKDNNIIFVE